jgi:hypothetical protein
MILQGKTDGELVINHRPCQPTRWLPVGWDEALERYLPQGYSLTVHGRHKRVSRSPGPTEGKHDDASCTADKPSSTWTAPGPRAAR